MIFVYAGNQRWNITVKIQVLYLYLLHYLQFQEPDVLSIIQITTLG